MLGMSQDTVCGQEWDQWNLRWTKEAYHIKDKTAKVGMFHNMIKIFLETTGFSFTPSYLEKLVLFLNW